MVLSTNSTCINTTSAFASGIIFSFFKKKKVTYLSFMCFFFKLLNRTTINKTTLNPWCYVVNTINNISFFNYKVRNSL